MSLETPDPMGMEAWNKSVRRWHAVWDQLKAHRPEFADRGKPDLDCALAEIRRLQALDKADAVEPRDAAPTAADRPGRSGAGGESLMSKRIGITDEGNGSWTISLFMPELGFYHRFRFDPPPGVDGAELGRTYVKLMAAAFEAGVVVERAQPGTAPIQGGGHWMYAARIKDPAALQASVARWEKEVYPTVTAWIDDILLETVL